jgi:hypothetical protein
MLTGAVRQHALALIARVRQRIGIVAGRPALLCTVNVSPVAGAPLICTCQPFKGDACQPRCRRSWATPLIE